MRNLLVTVLLAAGIWPMLPNQAVADPSEVSVVASELSVAPASLVALSAMQTGEWVLAGLQASAEGAVATFESVIDGSRYSIALSARALQQGASLVGQSVQVSAELAGTALWVGSELLLFVPSQLLLTHHHRGRIE